ncbi:electron transport complex subunit E [Agaribacterium haliotis]|uniref:electron transport complex subunit E n=1 Tax=Agaribacterium haliotis TaxID=2013869 RepID=UPI000BB59D02|nr:electron transport complex subunit E [Agaribacterium haliotis]
MSEKTSVKGDAGSGRADQEESWVESTGLEGARTAAGGIRDPLQNEHAEQDKNQIDSPCQQCPGTKNIEAGKFRDYFNLGLWQNNIALVQLLGLCPVMAVTTSASNGLGMGLATMLVLVVANVLVSTLRNFIPEQIRNPIMIAIIAGTVTLVDLIFNAYMHELYKVLGLFIALIVTNCAILGRTESFAMKQPPLAALVDALGMGLGFTWALVVLGGVREILGSGTLFAHASLLLGSSFSWLELKLFDFDSGLLLSILPPGGFIVLGLLIALKRLIDDCVERNRNSDLSEDQALVHIN